MKSNSKEYPTVQWLQGVCIVPVNITEKTNEEGEVSYDFTRIDLPDNSTNRNKTAAELVRESTLLWLSEEKKTRLTAGFLVGDTLFDSDSNARLAYAELAMKFQSVPTFTKQWKAANDVWVAMDATMFAQVMVAGEAHITSVFAWLEVEQSKV